MTQLEQTINSRCHYIMAKDSREFMAVKITNPRLFDSDHHAVVAVLKVNYRSDNKIFKKECTSFI
jgi:hypothetical protein